jgi:hypothetical protein
LRGLSTEQVTRLGLCGEHLGLAHAILHDLEHQRSTPVSSSSLAAQRLTKSTSDADSGWCRRQVPPSTRQTPCPLIRVRPYDVTRSDDSRPRARRSPPFLSSQLSPEST